MLSPKYFIFNAVFVHLGYSLKKGTRGSVSSAVGAGEDGGGEDENGGKAKES